MVLVALWPVGSSWIRDQTHVSCTGKQILYHWATRKALSTLFSFGQQTRILGQSQVWKPRALRIYETTHRVIILPGSGFSNKNPTLFPGRRASRAGIAQVLVHRHVTVFIRSIRMCAGWPHTRESQLTETWCLWQKEHMFIVKIWSFRKHHE